LIGQKQYDTIKNVAHDYFLHKTQNIIRKSNGAKKTVIQIVPKAFKPSIKIALVLKGYLLETNYFFIST